MRRTALRCLAMLMGAILLLGAASCRDRTNSGTQAPAATATPAADSAATTLATPATSTPAASLSPGCGKPLPAAVAAGASTVRKLNSGSRERTYRLHIPASYSPGKPAALVLNFHGRGSNGLEQEIYSRLVPLSDRDGFILVSPDGIGESWLLTPGVDDVQFARDLVGALEGELCLDPGRVFSTGISNGAFMSSRLACVASGLVAAVAPVAGVGPSEGCGKPVPLLGFQGTDDQLVRFDGGPLPVAGNYPGVMPMMAAWAKQNGCGAEPKDERVSAAVRKLTYPGCKAATALYIIEGGGHTWPGSVEVPRLGPTTKEISAAELIWAFFQANGR